MNAVTAPGAVNHLVMPEVSAPAARATFIPGRWHAPAALDALLCDFAREMPDRAHIADFLLPRIGKYVLCSDTLKTEDAASARLPLHEAVRCRWISLNSRHWINAVTVDCDHSSWREELRALSDQGEPDPTFVTWNPSTDHAQVTWVLPIGARRSNARQMRLLDGVRARLTAALSGDSQFKNWLIRNPLHPDNSVLWFSPQAVELSALLGPLVDWCDEGEHVLPPRVSAQHEGRKPSIAAIPTGLHDVAGPKGSRVFELGAAMVRRLRTSDRATIRATLDQVASDLKSPITARQLDGMAGRIARWMAKQPWATGRPVNGLERPDIDHGAMTREARDRGMLDAWIRTPRATKLPLAAERTNQLRKGKTRAAILTGVDALARSGQAITQAALAHASGLTVRTIRRAWTDGSMFAGQEDTRSYPFCAALPPPEYGTPPLTLARLAARSQARAKRLEEDARIIAAYDEAAARMTKRGGKPEKVPPRGPDASPAVVDAHQNALAARRDAMRRQEARQERKEMAERSEARKRNFRAWADAEDPLAFQTFYRAEVERWEERENRIDPAEKERVRRHHERRGRYLRSLREAWAEAQKFARLRREDRDRKDRLPNCRAEVCAQYCLASGPPILPIETGANLSP